MEDDRQPTENVPSSQDTAAERLPFPRPSFWNRLRFRVVAPYLVLALIMSIAGTFFLARILAERLHERLLSQLWEAGHYATDAVVYVERELLASLRAIARTQGVAEATALADSAQLHILADPIAVNNALDFVEITDLQGRGILSLHRLDSPDHPLHYTTTHGLPSYDWPLVQLIARREVDDIGDKFASLVPTPWGWTFYISGPIKRTDGTPVGIVMVGMALPRMVQRMANRGDPVLGASTIAPIHIQPQASARPAEVTIYSPQGQVIATTFQDVPTATLAISPEWYQRARQGQEGPQFVYLGRGLDVHGEPIEEAFGSFEARHGEEKMAVFSVALPGYQREQILTQLLMTLFFSLAVVAIVMVGLWVSAQIVRPILELVHAASQVEQGSLAHKVLVSTEDEIGLLAHAFNRMIQGLRVKEYIRDAFGRFVSRDVSESLLRGEIRLQGEKRVVSMLFADIRDFTRLSEQYAPDVMVRILNDYFAAMVEVAQTHGGTVNKFGGDSTLVIFGAPVYYTDHADRAVESALAMRRRLAQLNAERLTRGEVPIRMGIGVNTGEVVAGTVGSADRMEYTVIGDAVNLSARVQGLNKEFPEYDILISEYTCQAFQHPDRYTIRDLGAMTLKGKSEAVRIYAVLGSKEQAPHERETGT